MIPEDEFVYLMVTTIFSPFAFLLKLYFLYVICKKLIDYYFSKRA